jgi:hypothetical protein
MELVAAFRARYYVSWYRSEPDILWWNWWLRSELDVRWLDVDFLLVPAADLVEGLGTTAVSLSPLQTWSRDRLARRFSGDPEKLVLTLSSQCCRISSPNSHSFFRICFALRRLPTWPAQCAWILSDWEHEASLHRVARWKLETKRQMHHFQWYVGFRFCTFNYWQCTS